MTTKTSTKLTFDSSGGLELVADFMQDQFDEVYVDENNIIIIGRLDEQTINELCDTWGCTVLDRHIRRIPLKIKTEMESTKIMPQELFVDRGFFIYADWVKTHFVEDSEVYFTVPDEEDLQVMDSQEFIRKYRRQKEKWIKGHLTLSIGEDCGYGAWVIMSWEEQKIDYAYYSSLEDLWFIQNSRISSVPSLRGPGHKVIPCDYFLPILYWADTPTLGDGIQVYNSD